MLQVLPCRLLPGPGRGGVSANCLLLTRPETSTAELHGDGPALAEHSYQRGNRPSKTPHRVSDLHTSLTMRLQSKLWGLPLSRQCVVFVS